NDTQRPSQVGVEVEIGIQHVGIDGGGIDLAAGHQSDGSLVPPHFDKLPEITARLAQLGQVIARDTVTGLRELLVVGPSSAAEVRKRTQPAVVPYDDVGIVDRSTAITRPDQDRRGDRLEAPVDRRMLDIRQAAYEHDVHLAKFFVRDILDELGGVSNTVA